MTRNQIEYLKFQELERSNREQEEIARTRDVHNFELGQAQLSETVRSNQAREQHNVQVLGETKRANQAREKETYRANLMQEALADSRNVETARHNMALEQLQRDQLNEVRRTNQAREEEEYRSNLARELEQARSNQAREAETRRSNEALESQRAKELLEKTANDAAQRVLEGTRQAETKRSNEANEALTAARTAVELIKAENLKGAVQVNSSSTSGGSSTRVDLSNPYTNSPQGVKTGKELTDVDKPAKEFQPQERTGTSRSKRQEQGQSKGTSRSDRYG